MKTLREMMQINEHQAEVQALQEWAKNDPWNGLSDRLTESGNDVEVSRMVREVTQSIKHPNAS